MSTKGRSDYLAPGDYNACCDRCCAKFKASKLRKDWQGFMLCEWCWEPRQPQDFVRGRADPTPLPWVRECSHDNFVEVCAVPTASFTAEADPEDPFTVIVRSITPSTDACPVTCLYDFGDDETSTSCATSHTYEEAGTYLITYTATNSAGSDEATAEFVVVEVGPAESANFGGTYWNGSAYVAIPPFTGGSGYGADYVIQPGQYGAGVVLTNFILSQITTNPANTTSYGAPAQAEPDEYGYAYNTSSPATITVTGDITRVRIVLSFATAPGVTLNCTIADRAAPLVSGMWSDTPATIDITLDSLIDGYCTGVTFTIGPGLFFALHSVEFFDD